MRKVYIRDELSGRIMAVDPIVMQEINDKGGWDWFMTHNNGTQMWEDKAGGRALQVEADSEEEARRLLDEAMVDRSFSSEDQD